MFSFGVVRLWRMSLTTGAAMYASLKPVSLRQRLTEEAAALACQYQEDLAEFE